MATNHTLLSAVVISVNADTNRPLLVFGLCGLAGVSVDFFDGMALILGGPRWLHKLDVLVAVLYTGFVLGVGAYRR